MKNRIVTLFSVLLSSAVFASTVAVVDLEVLLNNTKSYTDAKVKLEAQVKKEQASLESMGKEIEALNLKFEKNRSAMTSADAEKMQKELSEKQNNYATKQMSVQRELYKSNQDALNTAFEQIRTAASKVGKEKKLELILPKTEAVFAQTDVTDAVKASLSGK